MFFVFFLGSRQSHWTIVGIVNSFSATIRQTTFPSLVLTLVTRDYTTKYFIVMFNGKE